MPVREAIHRYLTALRLVYVPFREAEPAQLHNACYRATAAKRHPDGQRDDGFTAYGRLPLAESGFFSWSYEILLPVPGSWPLAATASAFT